MGGFLYGAATRVLPLLNGIDDLLLKVACTHLKAYEGRRARQAAS